VSQRFTLDRESFEQFLSAVSLFQPLQKADTRKRNGQPPLLLYLLETFRDIDAGALSLQAALDRVAELTLRIVGGDGAAVWLFTSEDLFCRAVSGATFEDDHIRSVLRSKLKSAGAFGDDPPAKLDLARTMADCLGGNGSWLVIAILPGRQLAGGLAVYSSQSAAFTSRDFSHLRLLAGLAQYVATVSPKPSPVGDLYLPGLGTRAALGDVEEPSHLGSALRERTDRLAASMAGLVSSAADRARDSVVHGAQTLKRTASTIGHTSALHRPADKTPPSPPESAHQIESARWRAARSSVSGPKLSQPEEQLSLATDRLMKKMRRTRFLALKLIGDALEQISSTWDRLSRARTSTTEQSSKEARQEVGLWTGQWTAIANKARLWIVRRLTAAPNPRFSAPQPTAAATKLRFWVAQRFTAAVNAITSAPEVTTFPPPSNNLSSVRSAHPAAHSQTPLQSFISSARHQARAGRHHLRSAIARAGRTLRSARNMEVNWLSFRKAAPALVVLAVIFSFVLAQLPATKSEASNSKPPAPVSHPTTTPTSHLTLATAPVTNPIKSQPVPTETSHLKVTDRDTESTIAELSRYEVRNLPRAANYGDDEAAFQLGMLYELGLGFTQNCAKAAEWVTKAAQAGNPAAEYNLALRYRDGDGVTPNPQEADLWLRKANAHKNLPPDHELAALPAQPPASVRQ
jgi:hypothetical protein